MTGTCHEAEQVQSHLSFWLSWVLLDVNIWLLSHEWIRQSYWATNVKNIFFILKFPSELLRNSTYKEVKTDEVTGAYANVSNTAAIMLEIIFFNYVVLFKNYFITFTNRHYFCNQIKNLFYFYINCGLVGIIHILKPKELFEFLPVVLYCI